MVPPLALPAITSIVNNDDDDDDVRGSPPALPAIAPIVNDDDDDDDTLPTPLPSSPSLISRAEDPHRMSSGDRPLIPENLMRCSSVEAENPKPEQSCEASIARRRNTPTSGRDTPNTTIWRNSMG